MVTVGRVDEEHIPFLSRWILFLIANGLGFHFFFTVTFFFLVEVGHHVEGFLRRLLIEQRPLHQLHGVYSPFGRHGRHFLFYLRGFLKQPVLTVYGVGMLTVFVLPDLLALVEITD